MDTIKKLLNTNYPATQEQTKDRLQALLESFTISPSEDILNLIYAIIQKGYKKQYTIADLATIFPELTKEDWDKISSEVIAEDEVIWSCYDKWRRNPCSSQKERENIFIDDRVLSGQQAEAMRKEYLLTEYEEACKEGDEKRKEKIKSEYHWRYEVGKNMDRLEGVDIDRARETPIADIYPLNGKTSVPCPFHKDSTPSLHITKNLWNCFSGCGGGNTIDFVMKLQNLTFPQAVKFILHL